jgi:hypothetical protein
VAAHAHISGAKIFCSKVNGMTALAAAHILCSIGPVRNQPASGMNIIRCRGVSIGRITAAKGQNQQGNPKNTVSDKS